MGITNLVQYEKYPPGFIPWSEVVQLLKSGEVDKNGQPVRAYDIEYIKSNGEQTTISNFRFLAYNKRTATVNGTCPGGIRRLRTYAIISIGGLRVYLG